MKFPPRIWFVFLLLVASARADQAHVNAMKQVIDGLARLDAVYVAVSAKKDPLKALETALGEARDQFRAVATQAGVSAELGRELQAAAGIFDTTIQYLVKDTAEDEPRLFRAADDLAELTLLAARLGGAVGPAARLTATERRELGAQVESRFGKKVREFPRGDTSPFASGSRSPFATAMWTINLAFDDTVKR